MPENKTDRRRLDRRPLRMPVAYTIENDNSALAGYYFGWTANVHMQGICIKAKPNQLPMTGRTVNLLVMSQANDRLARSDVSVRIKGKVVWTDRETENFGVYFPNGNSI